VNRIAATLLSMETIVVLLSVPVALNLSDVGTVAAWVAGGGVALLCVVAAATVRRGRVGYVIGSAAQVAAIGIGFVVPVMFALGAIFALLWFTLMRIGPEVERAKAARENGT
jgi:hypothetical protein